MAKIEFELNLKGVANLMKSSDMQSTLQKHAETIKNRSGVGYEQDMRVGKNRANARVWAETSDAQSDNSKNNTLLKSVR